MTGRREIVADAAIAVLAARGPGALTHRAVDAEAGLPAGSASNVVRSKRELVDLAWQRIAELDAPWVDRESALLRTLLGIGRKHGAEPADEAIERTAAALAPRLVAAARERRDATRARVALDALFESSRSEADAQRRVIVARAAAALDVDPVASGTLVVVVDGWLRREATAESPDDEARLAASALAIARVVAAGAYATLSPATR